MVLRTVEPKKRTLHTQNKQIKCTSVSNSISPNKSSGNPGGQMPNASDCFFMPEDKKSQNLTGNPIKSRTKVSTKQRSSGKILWKERCSARLR